VAAVRFGLTGRARVPVTPFLDLVLAWNTGISYGLFQEAGPLWQWVLLGFKVTAVALLLIWLARTHSRLAGVALGLIMGGAIGNAIDRVVHGAVMDFVYFISPRRPGPSNGMSLILPMRRSLPA